MAQPFDLAKPLAERRRQSLYRQRQVVASPQRPELVIDGKPYLAFCSNDYLGLASDERVIAAMAEGASRYGAGSGASHLVVGHQQPHQQLEEALAQYCGRERALLFSSGYMANIGVVNALIGKQDSVLEDRLNHASLLDAGLLSRAKFQRYPHNDARALENRISKIKSGRCLAITDGVFSMDGDKAALPELAAAARRHNAWLMVDDAHGFGVLGDSGAGLIEESALSAEHVPVWVATLGKALGTAGAFVAGSHELIETCIQWSRTYIYSTGIPPAVAHASLTSLRLAQQEGWRRERLNDLIKRFRSEAKTMGLQLKHSTTPIQPIVIGEPEHALLWQQKLQELGIIISAIRPPTVPAGTSRLRITFSALHNENHLQQLLTALDRCNAQLPAAHRNH